jgi:hypothetical protein
MVKLLRMPAVVVLTFRVLYMVNCLLYLIFLQSMFGRATEYFFQLVLYKKF